MKTLITLIAIFTTSALQAGWFSSDTDKVQQQLQQTQAQLVTQQASTGNWQLAAGILAVSCILLFLIGTAIGSKARRNGKQPDSGE